MRRHDKLAMTTHVCEASVLALGGKMPPARDNKKDASALTTVSELVFNPIQKAS